MHAVKKFSSVLVIISLSFITVVAQQHSADRGAAESANWINIAPEGSGFRLFMPGKPSVRVDPVKGSPGVENHMFMLDTPPAGYVFSYVQFPQEITDPASVKGMLDAGREGAIATSGAKLKSEREIRLNEHYGREWLLELPGGLMATNHAFWVKRRLYQLVVVVAPNTSDTPETIRLRQDSANRYFDSFRLVSEVGN
jgi:hypothetical protein